MNLEEKLYLVFSFLLTMLNTQTVPQNFPVLQTQQVQEQADNSPVLLSLASAVDFGVLCPDFPSLFTGATSSNLYLSPMQYFIYCSANIVGSQQAPQILSMAKEYNTRRSSLEAPDLKLSSDLHERAMVLFRFTDENLVHLQKNSALMIMVRGCLYAFSQNRYLREVLCSTRDRQILFLSADSYFGTGSNDPNQLLGQNYYGQILMDLRNHIVNNRFEELTWVKEAILESERVQAPLPEPVVAENNLVPEVAPEVVKEIIEEVKEKVEEEIAPVEVSEAPEVKVEVVETKPESFPLPQNVPEAVEQAKEELAVKAEKSVEENVAEAINATVDEGPKEVQIPEQVEEKATTPAPQADFIFQ